MRTCRVLLVEDSRDDEFFTMRALGDAHRAWVRVTRSGPEALSALRRSARRGRLPDLVVLDIGLPGMDGLEVLRRIRNDRALRGLRVVVLTSSTDADTRASALAMGADDFLRKPLTEAKVRGILRDG